MNEKNLKQLYDEYVENTAPDMEKIMGQDKGKYGQGNGGKKI